ncbi:flavodoxin family protein [Flavobacterium tyrosinilyticum]|uniref:flavodoxin family protein n=1 Tax=Flavobacterium tyrosinilyticum TaxID=1658740 RepID=UPI002030F5A3|nr:flavodoxin [Flavobacterium tyrosinilyticum]MCM0667045.1 flavodoxin [Flavobacterium tyrosinilyticum]
MKKSTTFLYIITVLICLFSSCSKAQESTQNKAELSKDKNILIVYLSRTKNTKAVAEIIHKNVGGALVELELQKPYPEDYKEIVSQVSKENEIGFLPPLKTKITNVEKFDMVFVGFPTWGMQLPPPMKSFLKEYNLEGKTVIPFNTNAGYGVGSSFQTVKELCAKSSVLEGFSVKGGIERDGILFVMEGEKEKQVQVEIQNWLKKIKMVN